MAEHIGSYVRRCRDFRTRSSRSLSRTRAGHLPIGQDLHTAGEHGTAQDFSPRRLPGRGFQRKKVVELAFPAAGVGNRRHGRFRGGSGLPSPRKSAA